MKGGEGKGEEDMEFEERTIRKLKKGKVAEEDEIQNEV